MIINTSFSVIFLCLCLTFASSEKQGLEVGESRAVNTIARRSDDRHRAQVVTGTFRFRRVVNGDSSASSSDRPNGWDIEGCYCAAGNRCSCTGNRNRVKMFVRTGSRSKAESPGNRGTNFMPGIPLPSPGDTSGAGDLQDTERERLRDPGTDGCFCNGGGCSGSSCGSLNGCVCNSSGRCWGAACSARVPVPSAVPVAGQLTTVVNSANSANAASPQIGQVNSSPGVQQVLSSLNPLNLVRNALMAQPALVNGQQVMQITPISGGNIVVPAQGNDCTCNQNGCTGAGCASLNGCFCVGQNCWGNACQSSVFSQQLRQPVQQSGNLFDIPDLFGGNGGGNGDGGGMDVEGQVIPVVQGMPVKRLNGQRARRIRNGVRGRRGMGGMAASGRIRTRTRPEQLIKKRTRIRNSGANNDNEDSDWEAKPIFRRVNVNGIPTFVRFSRRTDSTGHAEEPASTYPATQSTTHTPDEVTEHEKHEKPASLPVRENSDDQQSMSGEESERLEAVYDEPLMFSENVLDVKIMSLEKR